MRHKYLDGKKMTVYQLGIAITSLCKKLVFGEISPAICLKQLAHRCGMFRGSRQSKYLP
jgi:hypothetical protein